MNLKEKAKKLKADIPIVYLSLKDKDTPLMVKILAGITVAYALSPIDLIPDFIPILGYLDDIIILPLLIKLTIKCIPYEVWKRNEKKSENLCEEKKYNKWYYSIPIILIWLLVLFFIIKSINKLESFKILTYKNS